MTHDFIFSSIHLLLHASTRYETIIEIALRFFTTDEFPKIAKCFNADEIIKILNIIYVAFDKIGDETNIYKVETVGEVYMMVAGCPNRSVNHALKAAKTALLMLQHMPRIRKELISTICGENKNDDENRSKKIEMFNKINVKLGLNSGAVTAGVIGETCQRFKLFGDTVNTASRMETNSEPGMITCSESTFRSIIKIEVNSFKFKKREPLQVKGKGLMQTFFVVGSKDDDVTDFDKDLTENFIARG